MNSESLQKEINPKLAISDVLAEDDPTNTAKENNPAEKTKKDSILIKEPNLFQLRDFFKEKANETSKEKHPTLETQVKTNDKIVAKSAIETEIKITKSADCVIKLIKQPAKEIIKPTWNESATATEPVKDLIKSTEEVLQLKKIIEEEFNKAKEGLTNLNKVSEAEITKSAEEKITSDKQSVKTITKPVEAKSNIAKEPVKETLKSSEDKNNIDNLKTKIITHTAEKKIVHTQEPAREIKKAAEVKTNIIQPSPKKIIEQIETGQSSFKKTESELNKLNRQENVSAQRGLRELSSLSIEDRKSYFKTQKEPSSRLLKISLILTVLLLTLSISYIIYSNFLNKVQDNQPEKLITQTIPEFAKDKIEKPNVNNVTVTEVKIQGNEAANLAPIQKTNASIPPPLPEVPDMIETPASKLAENFESDNKETLKNLEEKSPLSPPKEEKQIEDEPSFFVAVEEMPEPLGGLAEIQKRIEYPKVASLTGVEGKVYVRALVNESGNVANAEVIKGIGAGCDEAALDAVLKTKFKPGIQRGKPVKVQVTIPIVFKKK
jgi:protein TonB